jgi:hypothetical protein
MVLLRTWLAFSVVSFVVAVVCSVVDHDNPLKSDDPYIVGGIAGGFCAGFAFVCSVVGELGGSRTKQLLAYFGLVLSVSVFLIVVDVAMPSPEGQGILTLFGVLIAVSSAATYPLLKIPLTKLSLVCASIPGIIYLLGYVCATIAMNARNF